MLKSFHSTRLIEAEEIVDASHFSNQYTGLHLATVIDF